MKLNEIINKTTEYQNKMTHIDNIEAISVVIATVLGVVGLVLIVISLFAFFESEYKQATILLSIGIALLTIIVWPILHYINNINEYNFLKSAIDVLKHQIGNK